MAPGAASCAPDGYGRWREHDREVDFFLEYDRGTEPLDRVAAELDADAELLDITEIRTPTLFWLPTHRREAALRNLLESVSVPVATASPTLGRDPADAVWLAVDATDGRAPPSGDDRLLSDRTPLGSGAGMAPWSGLASDRRRRRGGPTMSWQRINRSRLVLRGVEDLGCDGGELADLDVGQDREEVLVQVTVVPGPGGFERRRALRCQHDVDGPTVGRVGFTPDESLGLQAADDSRHAALTQGRAAAEFGHRHAVIVRRACEKQKHLELMEPDAVFVGEASAYGGDASDLPPAVLQDSLDAVATGHATVPVHASFTLDHASAGSFVGYCTTVLVTGQPVLCDHTAGSTVRSMRMFS